MVEETSRALGVWRLSRRASRVVRPRDYCMLKSPSSLPELDDEVDVEAFAMDKIEGSQTYFYSPLLSNVSSIDA